MLNVQGLLQLLRVGIVQTPEGDYGRIRQLLELLLLITLDEVPDNVCHGYLCFRVGLLTDATIRVPLA